LTALIATQLNFEEEFMGGALMSGNEVVLQKKWKRNFFVTDDEQIRKFARGIEDANFLHHDTEAAKVLGFSGIIAPGVMIVGFVSSTIASEIPGVLVLQMEMSFGSPVYANSFVSVSCEVSRKRGRLAKVSILITSEQGDKVANGSCLLLLPQ
jgi:acyl dehydratase